MLRGQLPQKQSCFSMRSALLSLTINKILDRVEILTTLQKTKKEGGEGALFDRPPEMKTCPEHSHFKPSIHVRGYLKAKGLM